VFGWWASAEVAVHLRHVVAGRLEGKDCWYDDIAGFGDARSVVPAR
jgi:hypothetical protein